MAKHKRKIQRGTSLRVVARHEVGEASITRAQFHTLVRKAAQPIRRPSESDLASGETSELRHSDV